MGNYTITISALAGIGKHKKRWSTAVDLIENFNFTEAEAEEIKQLIEAGGNRLPSSFIKQANEWANYILSDTFQISVGDRTVDFPRYVLHELVSESDIKEDSPWQPADTVPPNELVLIRYYKGGSSYRTRVSGAYIIIEAKYIPPLPAPWWNPVQYKCECPFDGDEWVDALGRLLVSCKTKNPKNYVTHWMPKPTEPESFAYEA
jgi:hypothetical protein